jgi:hypothetical protein
MLILRNLQRIKKHVRIGMTGKLRRVNLKIRLQMNIWLLLRILLQINKGMMLKKHTRS